MKRLYPLAFFLAASILAAQPVTAQVDLTDTRTPEQKWARSTWMMSYAWTAMISHAKSVGQSPEEFGHWISGYIAPTWGAPGARTLQSFVRGMFLNYNLWNGLEFEVLSDTPTEVRLRMNTPYSAFFGESRVRNDTTLDEFRRVLQIVNEDTADYLGFEMSHEVDGDWMVLTVRTRS